MSNLAGSFKSALLILIVAVSGPARAESTALSLSNLEQMKWSAFEREIAKQERQDKIDGMSYVISGSLALIGGIAGASISQDPLEIGIYSIFQTIGIASIGYGSYQWQIGGDEREFYTLLQRSNLSIEQKTSMLKTYAQLQREREQKNRLIRAVTHGLIAGLNIYSASRQEQEAIRTGLYFLGGVNLLAALSYSIEF